MPWYHGEYNLWSTNLMSSFLRQSGHLCQFWTSSLKAFLTYLIPSNQTNGRTDNLSIWLRLSPTQSHNKQKRGGSVPLSSRKLSWAYGAVMMLPYYSQDAERKWKVFLGDGSGLKEAWLIISSCMLTLEALMKYSVWCWNVRSFFLC